MHQAPATSASVPNRVGQDHKYTVYLRYFWQGYHQMNCHTRFTYIIHIYIRYTNIHTYIRYTYTRYTNIHIYIYTVYTVHIRHTNNTLWPALLPKHVSPEEEAPVTASLLVGGGCSLSLVGPLMRRLMRSRLPSSLEALPLPA